MATDYESGTKKTIDLTIRAEKMTADILKSAMQELLQGKAQKAGRMTIRQLEKKSPSKLDSIEVSESNIGDFLAAARKYDVDFALKCDKSTSPPTYHVFFSTAKTENFNKAFSEYTKNLPNKRRCVFTRDQLKNQAQRIQQQPRKQKQREKTRENRR